MALCALWPIKDPTDQKDYRIMEHQRNIRWDYLRAFILFLLFIDHCFHAYGTHFSHWHFIYDLHETSPAIDMIYFFLNVLIMPALFFVIGLFVVPHLQTKGMAPFLKNRLKVYGIPWLIGIPLIVPLLCYPRFLHHGLDASYGDYLTSYYFPRLMQGGGPFWVLWFLLFLTLLATFLRRFFSQKPAWLTLWLRHKIMGVIIFTFLVCTLCYLGDLVGGTYHWIGFNSLMENTVPGDWTYHILGLFKVQANRFLLQAFFFFLGVSLGATGLMNKESFWQDLSRHWKKWGAATGLSMALILLHLWAFYEWEIDFSLLYTQEFAHYFAQGYEGPQVWSSFMEHLTHAAPRLIFQGIFLVCAVFFLITLFQAFRFRPAGILCFFTRHSYGFFLLHEIPVIWMQFKLQTVDISPWIKALVVMGVSFPLTLGFVWFFQTFMGSKIRGLSLFSTK